MQPDFCQLTIRDGPTIGICARVVVGDLELAEHGQALRGESLVELNNVEVGDGQAQPLDQLVGRWRRTDPHDARRNASYGCTEHSWCWPYLSQHQYSEHHKYEFWRDRRCHVIGKSYHGTEYRTGGDYCGPEF